MATPTADLARYTDSATGADVELSIAEIKRTFCPKATDQEAANFLHLCKYMGLNPFVKDAYLIKFGDNAASMVVGKDAFMKRADAHPQFAGIISGVIVLSGDKIDNRTGTLVLKGDEIVGGWARVARNDRKVDVDVTVTFSEFNNNRGLWKTMPSVMIEKCAIVTALRRAFPATFSGMYDSAEMGVDLSDDLEPALTNSVSTVVDGPVVIEAERVDEIVEATQALIAEAKTVQVGADGATHPNGCDCQECFPVAIEAVADDATGALNLQDVLEEIGAVERPADCDKDGHNHSPFEVITSPSTGARRWAHRFEYELNGESKTSWCVYSGNIPVPPEED